MLIIKRKKCTYYVKEESVILEYNHQYSSFNVYALQNRKRFKDFKQTLLDSEPYEYDTIYEAMSLAMKFGLRGMVAHKPVVTEDDIFLP